MPSKLYLLASLLITQKLVQSIPSTNTANPTIDSTDIDTYHPPTSPTPPALLLSSHPLGICTVFTLVYQPVATEGCFEEVQRLEVNGIEEVVYAERECEGWSRTVTRTTRVRVTSTITVGAGRRMR